MIKGRKASVLVVGAMAAVAIGGGVALASSGGDDTTIRPSTVSINDTLVDDSFSPSPEASPSESATSSPGSKAPSGASSTAPTRVQSTSGSGISADQARKIALKAAGGGRVTDIERETEHGRAVWDVEVQRGNVEHDIDIDRQTGDVLRHKKDHDDDRDDRDDDRYDD